MRYFLTVFLVFIITISYGQPKKGGRVKRKYRNVEQITQNLPDVVLHGRVRDIYRNSIAGATVEAGGLKRKVNTNSEGRFLLKNLPTGILRLKISFIGYRTKTVDYYLQPGVNDQYMALDQDDIHLEPLPVSPQKREQHIPDIPAAITVITGSLARHYNINDLSGAADFIPGSFFEDFGGGEAAFSVNGSSGSAGFPGLSPAVAIYSDNVPVSLPNGFSPTFLDMERVEVIKGPQNVLFGSRAYSGAVSLVSRQPGEEFDGYVIAGGGNFGKKEIQGALNMPVIKDMLYVRAAGIYNSRNGYTVNSGAVSLNGDNTVGGRLSVRFLPAYNHQADLKLNYRNDNEPGTAFLNNWIQNEQGETGLWDRIISLNNENGIGAQNELMDATLTYRLLRDEHTYLTSISSYRKGKSSSGKDADGTSLPALFLKSNSDADLFFQEIRYNFSRRSRTNGSIGINYIRGKGDFQQELSSNDQTLLTLLTTPGSFVMPSESRFPVNPQTLNPSPMAGVNLPGDHGEHMISNINEQSFQVFLQFTYQLTSRIFFTAGARGGYDLTKVSGESVIAGDSPSALGMYSNSDPNLLYSPGPLQSVKNSSLSVSGQAGLTYRRNENFNFFINAVRGRRPELIQFTWDNKSLILDPETVNSLEAGFKMSVLHRIFFDATGYFRQHKNVHAILWSDTEGRGLNSSDGKAKSYGVDAGLHVALLKGINLFGSYAWLNPVFDSTDVPGRDYIYGGNTFAFSPGHSFASGVSANFKILPLVGIFANSWYSRRSHFWFSESNTPGLEQLSYGILNANAGVKFDKPSVTVSVYGTNLLEENYIVSAGHPGGLFGLPTFVPGPPMMLGIKMMWEF